MEKQKIKGTPENIKAINEKMKKMNRATIAKMTGTGSKKKTVKKSR